MPLPAGWGGDDSDLGAGSDVPDEKLDEAPDSELNRAQADQPSTQVEQNVKTMFGDDVVSEDDAAIGEPISAGEPLDLGGLTSGSEFETSDEEAPLRGVSLAPSEMSSGMEAVYGSDASAVYLDSGQSDVDASLHHQVQYENRLDDAFRAAAADAGGQSGELRGLADVLRDALSGESQPDPNAPKSFLGLSSERDDDRKDAGEPEVQSGIEDFTDDEEQALDRARALADLAEEKEHGREEKEPENEPEMTQEEFDGHVAAYKRTPGGPGPVRGDENDPRLVALRAEEAEKSRLRRADAGLRGRAHPRRRAARAQGLVPVVRHRPVVRRRANNNPRGPQQPVALRRAMDVPPGRNINPDIVGWYYQNAFQPKYKQADMSQMYPWLFGRHGLYGSMYTEECRYPCQIINGVCECPH